MPKKPYVIVVGLDCMTGLQTSRIFAGHDVPVIGIAEDRNHYCARTRLPERILEGDISSEALIELLENLAEESNFDEKPVLVPCTDMSVFQISKYRERLVKHYRFALPDHDTVAMLMDKVNFYRFAMANNLAIPQTYFLENRQDAEKAAAELSYPAMIKPPMKTALWQEHSKERVYKVESAKEFMEVYDRCHKWVDMLLAQAWVVGSEADLYSCNCYFDNKNQPLVTFIARKIRQWPPETGTSCLGEEVRNDVVLEESLKLFKSVNYHGLGYVEMKRDQRTGEHFIIEPNIGRPTGRSAIAEAGGVELVYTAYCDIAGLPLPENRVQQYKGAKWISFRRDAQSAFYYWRRGELSLGDWMRSWSGKKTDAIFSWSDPLPFFVDFLSSFAKVKKKVRPQKPIEQKTPSVS
jgi:D-aspartate ligase